MNLPPPPVTDRRKHTVMVDGDLYTVKGEWDRGLVSRDRDAPGEMPGFYNPAVLDMEGKDISADLTFEQFAMIVKKAEREIAGE